jgi:hypothetical protein
MNTKVILILNAFNLLPMDARDGIFDCVESYLVRKAEKERRQAVKVAYGLLFSVIQHLRRLDNCPDDDVDQTNPV